MNLTRKSGTAHQHCKVQTEIKFPAEKKEEWVKVSVITCAGECVCAADSHLAWLLWKNAAKSRYCSFPENHYFAFKRCTNQTIFFLVEKTSKSADWLSASYVVTCTLPYLPIWPCRCHGYWTSSKNHFHLTHHRSSTLHKFLKYFEIIPNFKLNSIFF